MDITLTTINDKYADKICIGDILPWDGKWVRVKSKYVDESGCKFECEYINKPRRKCNGCK